MSSEVGGHCYCGMNEISSMYHFVCEKCKKKFHEECLQNGPASILKGDYLFNFKCSKCSGGEEEFSRMKLQWLQVVHLTLYNLQLAGSGMCGYFRWKENICSFIDKHWTTFFGCHRKKTSLWHGTVAGVLSQGCPIIFTSGAQELKETGWWRLSELKPPSPYKQATPIPKPVPKESPPSLNEAPKEGLRSRRGKTSIQSAMELKAKRSTLIEAKEMRKRARTLSSEKTTSSISSSSSSTTTTTATTLQTVDDKPLAFTGLFPKCEPVTGSLLADHLRGGVVPSTNRSLVSPRSGSLADCSDDGSNISQSSYLTEKDLKLQDVVPNLLLSDDVSVNEGEDSDLEIDPGTLSPPNMSSDLKLMRDSPTVQEMLSAIDSHSSQPRLSFNEDSSLHDSYLDNSGIESVSMETSNPDSLCSSNNIGNFSVLSNMSHNESQGIEEEPSSVVDSESDSESSSSQIDQNESQSTIDSNNKKHNTTADGNVETLVVPETEYRLMSIYEEERFLKKLELASKSCSLPPNINRLKTKLKVRQKKRSLGLQIFDLDAEMNKLSQRCYGLNTDRILNIPSNCYHGDMRILDKFQTASDKISRSQLQQQPSFLNRLIGYEDDQLHSFCSPYTQRILKPFIRQDHEIKPLKMKLLEEIKAYPHRNDPAWKPEPSYPIDYCYVRPQHIASVNTLCREFFWPGIDVSECLQYPDFSCIVLYRKIVIGFAFMVPDVKHNEAYISFIFVHPEWRRSNMATFMLYHLIQTCMGKDVTLHCSATNTAMLLYQKFGFKPEEFILDFYDKYFPADSTECKHAFLLRLKR
ncbi:Cysteine-rich protein 2-binding protein [Mactra antiquata]